MTNYLYRGKRIREDEWVYGTLEKCYNEYGETFYRIVGTISPNETMQAMVVNNNTIGYCIDYTGDISTSIFEGDIIQYTCDYDGLDGFSKTYTCQAIAVYNEEEKQFGFVLNEEGVPEFFNWEDIITTNDFSIVGNIWDNSELVKVRLNEYFKND